jgi:hypothetical protein
MTIKVMKFEKCTKTKFLEEYLCGKERQENYVPASRTGLIDTINFGAIDTIRSDSEKTVFRKYQAIGGMADQKQSLMMTKMFI